MNVTTLNMTTLDGGVIIKKGGGGGSTPTPPSGGSNWRFFDVSGVSDISQIEVICMMMNTGDAVIPYSGLLTLTFATFNDIKDHIKYIGVCPFTIAFASGTQVFDDNMITMLSQQFNLTEITKEEFYSLD
jgi:hypothetical protein